jgi:hypothetical protein
MAKHLAARIGEPYDSKTEDYPIELLKYLWKEQTP